MTRTPRRNRMGAVKSLTPGGLSGRQGRNDPIDSFKP